MNPNDLKHTLLCITERNGLDLLHQEIDQIDVSDPIRIAFLGEFSTGKSTIVNALLKNALIPMLSKPTNANPVEIMSSDSNCFEVVKYQNGEEVKYSITSEELFDEVTNFEAGKRIMITLADNEFIANNVVLIDTPGVSSIEQQHTDVTIGFLPIIDAAVVCLSADIGDVPESSVKFLNERIKPISGLSSRLIFCITKMDLIPTQNERELVFDKIKSTLQTTISNARVIAISPKECLEAALINDMEKYNLSSINNLIKYIRTELPAQKALITQERLCKKLISVKELVQKQLETRMITYDYTTPQIDSEIEKIQQQVDLFTKDLSNFHKAIERIDSNIRLQISKEQVNLMNAIVAKATKSLPFDDDVERFAKAVSEIMEYNYSRENLEIESSGIKLSEILTNTLNPTTDSIKKMVSITVDIIIGVVSAFIIPGKTIVDGAGVAVSAASRWTSRFEKAGVTASRKMKFLRGVATVFGEIIPLKDAKDLISYPILKAKLTTKINESMHQVLAQCFDVIHHSLDELIKELYETPIYQLRDSMKKQREIKEKHIGEIDSLKEATKEDIRLLKALEC